MSSYRGDFDDRHEGHLEAFKQLSKGEASGAGDEEYNSTFIDLSAASPEEAIESLQAALARIELPLQETQLLPAPDRESMVPPGFMASIIYLPGIDGNDKRLGSEPHTFSIDRDNYREQLLRLRQKLIREDVLRPKNKSRAIIDQTRAAASPQLLAALERPDIEKFGFNRVFALSADDQYPGDADFVILVRNEKQIAFAEKYRARNLRSYEKVDIAICEDPAIQHDQLGQQNAMIYHY